jgi:NCS1 family nucleobase:cation symporter-1
LFGILLADFYLIKRGKVFVDDLFTVSPMGVTGTKTALTRKPLPLWYRRSPCLVISFIPSLHEVANFSWFIGVFLGHAVIAGLHVTIAKGLAKGLLHVAQRRRSKEKVPARGGPGLYIFN